MMVRQAIGPLSALALAACGAVSEPDPDAVASAISPDAAPSTPNILWIVAEDHGPHHGSYGDAYAATPNLDRLAAEGARFTRAFAVTPVCAPARSGIITGMYPTSIGAHHMRSTAVPPPHVKGFTEWLRAAGYFTTNNAKTDYNFSPWLPAETRRAVREAPLGLWDQNGEHAHWRNRAPGQPFFSVFNLGASHEGQVRMPDERFTERTAGLAPQARHDPAAAPLPPYYPDTPAVRRDIARYYDLVSLMDAQAGEILAALAADGLADDTVVFFYGDHGWGLPRGKRWVYDSGLRVPLLVRWPGRIEPGTVRDGPGQLHRLRADAARAGRGSRTGPHAGPRLPRRRHGAGARSTCSSPATGWTRPGTASARSAITATSTSGTSPRNCPTRSASPTWT